MRAQASQTYKDKNQIETKMWYHVGVSFMSKTIVQDPNTQVNGVFHIHRLAGLKVISKYHI